ncbi:hypothetical protein NDU88_002460 [Pleurodeles waltl]|uniref:RNase H type-1 domain-containing protein n=1 Tax=Pleurodeles waltl TaxID=8319 RepID=A0AAV7LFM9_PLEWA|nr:hypothetical protein NDU88_002460 [Pleurodeles waltl]
MVGQVRLKLGWIFGSRIKGRTGLGDFGGPVEVRAPPGHRVEERAQPGAVRLTPREAAVRESGSLDPILSFIRTIPASQGAMSGLVIDEEPLDYEDPVHGVQSVAVEKSKTSRRAVQHDRLSCRHQDLAGNLLRGEDSCEAGLVGVCSGGKAVVSQNTDNVDVAIQVGVGDGAEQVSWKVLKVLRTRYRNVVFNLDNQSVVNLVNSQRAREEKALKLLRVFLLKCLTFNVIIKAKYVPGVNNDVADALSRFQWQRFRGLAPGADVLKTAVPGELLCRGPRWRLFGVDSWALVRAVGRETSVIQAFWKAIGFGWG